MLAHKRHKHIYLYDRVADFDNNKFAIKLLVYCSLCNSSVYLLLFLVIGALQVYIVFDCICSHSALTVLAWSMTWRGQLTVIDTLKPPFDQQYFVI